MIIHEDRLFPADPAARAVARRLYEPVRHLPIVSPHGHTDPRWYAEDRPFPDPAQLFVVPDHYVFRMLYSQGVPLEDLGIQRKDGGRRTGAGSGGASPRTTTSSAARRRGCGSTTPSRRCSA
jgi:glucuronate isomerase